MIDVEVIEQKFTIDPVLVGKPTVAALTFQPLDQSDPFVVYYSCGKDWEPTEDGQGVQRIDGEPGHHFYVSTPWLLFNKAAFACGAEDPMRAQGPPWGINVLGLRFRLDEQPYTMMGKTKTRLMPVAYLGTTTDPKEPDERTE